MQAFGVSSHNTSIFYFNFTILSFILLYLRSELEKKENTQANVGNPPNSNAIDTQE